MSAPVDDRSSLRHTLRNHYKEAFRVAALAVDEDQADRWQAAKELYEEAGQRALEILKLETDPWKIGMLHTKQEEYATRAAELAALVTPVHITSPVSGQTSRQQLPTSPTNIGNCSVPPLDQATPLSRSTSFTFSPTELKVLKNSSYINGKMDPDGALALSPQQSQGFGGWKRAGEIFGRTMVSAAQPASIVQDVVTDCSVVASLGVSAAYEIKFDKQLLTNCVFPQTAAGVPTYNPKGKYIVKLILNGVARQVTVDDFLPVSANPQHTPLCAFSSTCMWPSIVEKAYLKVWGGYGFPGSNSGIDLHAMTGWIPENIFFQGDPNFDRAGTFRRLCSGLHSGNALMTLGTSAKGGGGGERVGLVMGHAYAVLDAWEEGGREMVRVRNPWRKLGTPNAERPLQGEESQGVFSLSFQDVCKWFETCHVNWNPGMWTHRHTLHAAWPAPSPEPPFATPFQPTHTHLGNNPQYTLRVAVPHDTLAAVWILLTKHVTRTEENTDYITLHVYDDTRGRRVWYPEHVPLVRGVYVNNPHVLVKFRARVGEGLYTVVLSQHERVMKALPYTLTVYAMAPFRVEEVPSDGPHIQHFQGRWAPTTAGGSLNHPTFSTNPRFLVATSAPSTDLTVTLKCEDGDGQWPVNLKLCRGGVGVAGQSTVVNVVANSGDYRRGFCVVSCAGIP
ncbi:calpain 7, partial [Thoreauomyces humboldtii]